MRIRQLEQVQQKFAVQQHKVLEIQQMLSETHEQVKHELSAKPDDVINPIISQQRFRYLQYLKMQVEHFQEMIRKEEKLLDSIREEMRQAHVKKKSLELLEEKQKKAYLKSIESQESKEIEDLVIARYRRP